MRALPTIAAICLTALGILGCDKGTPTAPAGSKLIITATPLQISASGTSAVTISATRSSGQPVNPGTEIRLDTSLGTIDEIVTTDDRGIARATLHGSGIAGTAKITARSGIADAVSVDVKVGAKIDKITLTATPNSVDNTTTTTVTLLAVVRDDLGAPVGGANVIFGSNGGTLASRGAIRVTNASGQATDQLTITATDAASAASGRITATAQAQGGGGTATATTEITIRVPPIANFDFAVSNRTVSFTDHSTGNPTSWSWDFDDGATSAAQNPTHTFPAAGSYDVTLRVTNAFGEDELTQTVTVQ
jgi:hypothetical protein